MAGMGFSSFEKFSPKHAHEKNLEQEEEHLNE
jgi:hypothetical protein